VSLEQLNTFVAVVEEGTVTHAARRLHISQPPLSRRLQSLEDELGVRLFARTPRGMKLTDAGRDFLPHARQILSAVEHALDAMQRPPPAR
jgi:DNA-binding transcriptional LysR family regulator